MAKEYQVSVNGNVYGMDSIYSLKIHQPLFSSFGVGNTCSQELQITFMPGINPDFMAEIIPYYKDPDEDVNSFTQLGVYYSDVREIDSNGRITITAYDTMLKTEQPFNKPGDIGMWPRTMDVVAQQIAESIGVEIDARSQISPYEMQYPNDYKMREVLGYIGAANGGNWIFTADNKLLLVPLFSSMPPATHYLVDSRSGSPLLFGNVRILV